MKRLLDFALGYAYALPVCLTTNLAPRQMTLSVPELDFVAQELKAAPDLYHSRLLRV
jgi:hypothetical protein